MAELQDILIKGIGIDIVEIRRLKIAIERHKGLVERLFTAKERAYCESKRKPYLHFAVRFAAKEAVLKAFGTGLRGMKWTDLEIDKGFQGKPLVNLKGAARKRASELGISRFMVSLSFSKENAIGLAIAINEKDESSCR